MRRLGWFLLSGGSVAASACMPAANTPGSVEHVTWDTKPNPPAAAPAAPAKTPPALRIEVTSHDKTENCLVVKLHFAGKLASGTTLSFRPTHAVSLSAATAQDEIGTVAVTWDEAKKELTVPASGRTELHVNYEVRFSPSGDAGAPFSESIELQAAGDDFLVLPELPELKDERFEFELSVKTGNTITGGASSFGLGHERKFNTKLGDLRGGFVIGGDVGTAEFHAGDGNDITAWVGHTAFDPRWVGAEVAATRAAVDVFVGRQHAASGPPLAFLIVPTKRDDLPVVMVPRTRGYLVSVDRRAVWSAQSRILVGQALAQRYLGGFVTLGPRDGADAPLWNDGFARMVGREVVYEMGMIEKTDVAAEMNQLLAAETFAKDPRYAKSVRGALMATALDANLKKTGSNVQTFIRDRLAEGAAAKKDEMRADGFRQRVGEALFDAKEIPLPVDLLGKCWRLEKKLITPFELGFTSSADQEMKVTAVVAKSRADVAGVKVGDVVEKIDYRPGRSDFPVKLTLKRGDKSISVTFTPAGAAKMGRTFSRVPGIPDEKC